MKKPDLATGALALMLCTMAGGAFAHNPVCQCEEDGDEIICTGGFSDGSGAPGVTIDVIDYEENVLLPGKLSDDSTLRFKRPDGEFYVLFDAGPGHVVEIDHTDISVQ
ncbi:hypothetical protein [Stutzerimonas kirkiae]|uniref:Secreted protein n=1 Tax=Stutzerimonas kirkiae TaxID=2211392 RepID=A0A4Q9RE13_9GAMM|nr:hypothetical protein [Stutzerimonas kirkiae]TBU98293.1 hypothetical protein DNJ96_05765 [Stutzerimonas kirkiae]TBV00967.1 hypothetical protein DNJ95_13635 [Stutzerimonas kirkiae]TBV07792.1 hypothetical protein DNK08_12270 [Stutzerimonas kirkiae]TBV16251.1 hypothetical protein DNK01_04645 [Stutzerimonas kirkiae]